MQFPAAELTGRHADMSEEAAAEWLWLMPTSSAIWVIERLGSRSSACARKATFRDEGKG